MVAGATTKGSSSERQVDAVLGFAAGSQAVAAQFGEALQLLTRTDEKVRLDVASSIWVKDSIRAEYTSWAAQTFRAQAHSLPDSVGPINTWVSRQTDGAIETLLEKLDPNTVAVLLNAVYFKASWAQPFDAKRTKPGVFHGERAEAPCNLMELRNKTMAFAALSLGPARAHALPQRRRGSADEPIGDAAMISLPYGSDGALRAEIVTTLGTTKLDDVVARVGEWDSWRNQLAPTDVRLRMPRFKIEYGVRSLKPVLVRMGMAAPFDAALSNKFARLSPDPSVFLSDVFHKAVLEVTEEGSVAAAASAAVMARRSMPAPPMEVLVDRPFLFAIVEQSTRQVLFLGRVDNPTLT